VPKRVQTATRRQTTRVQRESKTSPTRSYSKKQENDIAERFDGNRVKNSGATMFAKGDVSLADILVEAKTKTTHTKSFSIQKEWLEKNQQEALFMGKPYGVLAFNFGPNEPNHYIISEELFSILIGKITD